MKMNRILMVFASILTLTGCQKATADVGESAQEVQESQVEQEVPPVQETEDAAGGVKESEPQAEAEQPAVEDPYSDWEFSAVQAETPGADEEHQFVINITGDDDPLYWYQDLVGRNPENPEEQKVFVTVCFAYNEATVAELEFMNWSLDDRIWGRGSGWVYWACCPVLSDFRDFGYNTATDTFVQLPPGYIELHGDRLYHKEITFGAMEGSPLVALGLDGRVLRLIAENMEDYEVFGDTVYYYWMDQVYPEYPGIYQFDIYKYSWESGETDKVCTYTGECPHIELFDGYAMFYDSFEEGASGLRMDYEE